MCGHSSADDGERITTSACTVCRRGACRQLPRTLGGAGLAFIGLFVSIVANIRTREPPSTARRSQFGLGSVKSTQRWPLRVVPASGAKGQFATLCRPLASPSKISKGQAVTSQMPHELRDADVHVGPRDLARGLNQGDCCAVLAFWMPTVGKCRSQMQMRDPL